MDTPLISVVIPTKDRPETLAITLRSLRQQQSTRIEVVVQDNGAGASAAAVVKAAAKHDARIRYVKSPYPTSQRQSFEFALASALGDYMGIIGDDDSYCPGSLDWLVSCLEAESVDAVRWNLLFYIWPSLSTDGEGFFRLPADQMFGGSAVIPSAPLARKALQAATAGSWDNILVYHGLISRRIYDRMRAFSDGEFFAYPMPDVYAHNLLPQFCDRILQVYDVVSIYGMSGHSAGASWTRAVDDADPAAQAGKRWMAESRVDPVAEAQHWHPEIRTLRYHDFAALKRAEDLGMLPGRRIDTVRWIDAMTSEIRSSPWQIEAWFNADEKAPYDRQVFEAVRRRFAGERDKNISLPVYKHAPESWAYVARVRDVSLALNDDVEGACIAAGKITEPLSGRYGEFKRSAASTGKLRSRLAEHLQFSRLFSRPWDQSTKVDIVRRNALRERLRKLASIRSQSNPA